MKKIEAQGEKKWFSYKQKRVLSILKGLNPSQTAGIEILLAKFLKDGADVLAGAIFQLCNLLLNSTFSKKLQNC